MRKNSKAIYSEKNKKEISEKLVIFRKQLSNAYYKFHHSATATGYLPRSVDGIKLTPYKGRFGVGYKLEYPEFTNSQIHNVEYWIMDDYAFKEGDKQNAEFIRLAEIAGELNIHDT